MPASLLGSCLSHLDRFEEAIELYLEVAAGRMERLGPDNASVGEALANLASVLVRAGRVEEAVDPGREALATLRRTLGDHTSTASVLLTVAAIEEAVGNPQEALARTDEAITIYETMDGDFVTAIEEARAFREGIELRNPGLGR